MSTNPFDDDNGSFFVLVDDRDQHSLWPTFAEGPRWLEDGVRQASREVCLDYIERNWTDIRPRKLREKLA